MDLTDDQLETLKAWTAITPDDLIAGITRSFEGAFSQPEVREQIEGSIMAALAPQLEKDEAEWRQHFDLMIGPIIKALKKQQERIEKLEAALFRRSGL